MLVDISKEEMNIIIKALSYKIIANTEFLKIASSQEYVDSYNSEISQLQNLYEKYTVMANWIYE
ncbi:hypothetical protein [Clostridium lacusfryxellense]|uniref:hypothetical protein n=1 Tax=Clostridium lacusfryxellense TaxID=205328 RepID=UPI001C0B446A|nr:hypothetical protein [Clostridium lacusfryxellense]MBU3110393.1 hypothetical protein [Clostridium lacusfryxellense]